MHHRQSGLWLWDSLACGSAQVQSISNLQSPFCYMSRTIDQNIGFESTTRPADSEHKGDMTLPKPAQEEGCKKSRKEAKESKGDQQLGEPVKMADGDAAASLLERVQKNLTKNSDSILAQQRFRCRPQHAPGAARRVAQGTY